MCVLTETQDRLVLEDRPWLNALVFAVPGLIGAAYAAWGYGAGRTQALALGALLFAAGLFLLVATFRLLRLTVERDGTVTIATWRGSGWRSRTLAPGTAWARLTLKRAALLRSYGVALDLTEGEAASCILLQPSPFGYAVASEAVRRINLRLREPVLDISGEGGVTERWLTLDRPARRR